MVIKLRNHFLLIIMLLFLVTTLFSQKIEPGNKYGIKADFPGGNIVLDSIRGNNVFIHQNLHDNENNWFYWYFRVGKEAAGKTLTFQFTHPWKQMQPLNVIGVHGPAISFDAGKTWSWLGKEVVKGTSFKYTFPAKMHEIRFSFGMPYTEANLNTFLKRYQNNPNLEKGIIARTKGGRSVERLHVGNIYGDPKYRILLTARHHACEMMANYLLEGIVESVLAKDEEGDWFRNNVEILIIPFVDKDGVEDGDQGKYRRARDHNRDYLGESIYASTREIRAYIPVWSNGKLIAAMDLHCPWIRGKEHEQIHLVGLEDTNVALEQSKFSGFLQKSALQESLEPLPYDSSYNLPFGTAWNTSANYTKGKSMARWATELSGMKLATTLEFPYANASGTTITQKNARIFGHTIAHALYEYLLALHK